MKNQLQITFGDDKLQDREIVNHIRTADPAKIIGAVQFEISCQTVTEIDMDHCLRDGTLMFYIKSERTNCREENLEFKGWISGTPEDLRTFKNYLINL